MLEFGKMCIWFVDFAMQMAKRLKQIADAEGLQINEVHYKANIV